MDAEMKLAANRTRATAIALGLVLLAGLLLFSTHGCATSVAVQSSEAPPGALSLAAARQVFNTYVTTDDVARAAGDEGLELTLVNNAQVPLTAATFETAAYFGTPVPRYVYGTPRLYVPQMTGFPFWFAAVVRRTPLGGGPARTAIMVFSRAVPDDPWQLSVSTLLLPGETLPPISVGSNGHATALATFDHELLVTPNSTGAVQATVAEQGTDTPASTLIAPGPYTTGLRRQILSAKHKERRAGLAYDSQLDGTTFPLYALRTSDGGGLVLYSLNKNTVILRKGKRGKQIEIPQSFAPVLDAADNLVIMFELDTTETYVFATVVPPKRSGGSHGIIRIIAADGAPTDAGGN
jgi:hypothetical protein